jgi:uncharacterized protein (DUF2235 family)
VIQAVPKSSKNIVIFSDGTGQSYHGAESNVWRLYNLALKDSPHQIAFYDPGIGTHPSPPAFGVAQFNIT